MLLEQLFPYLRETPGKTLSRYHRFLQALRAYYQIRHHRFLASAGYEHVGISLLKQVLGEADYDWMSTKRDITSYMNHVQHIKPIMDGHYAQTVTGREYTNYFVGTIHSSRTTEFLAPTEDVAVFTKLPFDQKWDAWKSIKPVRLWYHDSPELSLNISHDRFNFHKTPPSYAVFTIDTVALTYKYHHWMKEGLGEEIRDRDGLTKQFFIHKHVICPMMEDLIDVWILQKILGSVLMYTAPSDIALEMAVDRERQYSDATVQYLDGMIALEEELNDIKESKLRPSIFLNSQVLFTGSLFDRIRESLTTVRTSSLRQYEYLSLLKDLDLIKLVMKIYDLSNLPTGRQIRLVAEREYRSMEKRKPWLRCGNTKIGNYIEQQVRTFGEDFLCSDRT